MLTSKFFPEALNAINQYKNSDDNFYYDTSLYFNTYYENGDCPNTKTGLIQDFPKFWNLSIKQEYIDNGNYIIDIDINVNYNKGNSLSVLINIYYSNGYLEKCQNAESKHEELFKLIDKLNQINKDKRWSQTTK